jgi:hypothetical protein
MASDALLNTVRFRARCPPSVLEGVRGRYWAETIAQRLRESGCSVGDVDQAIEEGVSWDFAVRCDGYPFFIDIGEEGALTDRWVLFCNGRTVIPIRFWSRQRLASWQRLFALIDGVLRADPTISEVSWSKG